MKVCAGFAATVLSLVSLTQEADARESSHSAEPYLLVSTLHTDDGEGGTSFDRDAILVTPIPGETDGSTAIYDLPPTSSEAERSSNWHLPAIIRVQPDGSRTLVNETELAAKVDPWLERGGYTRETCGHWIFTWSAFKIDCDPLSVLAIAEEFDLGPIDLQVGRPVTIKGATASGKVKLARSSATTKTYIVNYTLNPDFIRRTRAESDVVVGQILKKPVTLEEALAGQGRQSISGEISDQFETDQTGRIIRRTTTTTIVTVGEDGKGRTSTSVRTLERQKPKSVKSDR
jgi:hypothetical protein